jgi:hypothetical protein
MVINMLGRSDLEQFWEVFGGEYIRAARMVLPTKAWLSWLASV